MVEETKTDVEIEAEAKVAAEAAQGAEGKTKAEGAKETTVSMARFEEQEAKLKAAEQTNLLLEQQRILTEANAPAAAAAPKFDIFKEAGLDVDSEDVVIPDAKQLKMILDHQQKTMNAQLSQLRFLAEHPDYPDVVGTVEQVRAGQFAEPLAEAIKANPALLPTILNSPNPQIAAYEVAKLHAKQADGGTVTTKEAKAAAAAAIDEAVKNANRTKSSSVVNAGSALSEEGRYAAMSDEEFVELARKSGATV